MATLRNIVFLDQRVIAMIVNCMKVQIEGDPSLETQLADRIKPAPHEYRITAGLNAAVT